MRVCVVGLGTIGTPTVKYIHEHGFEACGYDLTEKSLDGIETFTDWERVPESDIYVVAVTSDNVENVCKEISSKDKGSFVAIESTVRVGACRKIVETFGLQALVHCPHRYWEEDPVNHGVRQLRVIGAINEQSLERGLEFYRSLDIPLHVCPTIEIAEMCKIAENAKRFVQIAFSEELKMICEEKKISFDEVRKACNTKWNIEILEAREGIFGSCLPKDIRYLKLLTSRSPLIDGAILTDEIYQKRRKKCLK
jgi:UDP-N-acetyl-D-mannosaminuronate dehydrogenase